MTEKENNITAFHLFLILILLILSEDVLLAFQKLFTFKTEIKD